MSRRLRRILVAGVSVLALTLGAAALAWACVPQADSFSLSRTSGPPDTDVTATGTGFPDGQWEIRWDTPSGPVLATATAAGSRFSASFKIPAAPAGVHYVIALPAGCSGHACHAGGTAAFEVTGASSGAGSTQSPGTAFNPALTAPAPNAYAPNANASRRARAIARCKRKYRGKSSRAKRKRRACIRTARRRFRA